MVRGAVVRRPTPNCLMWLVVITLPLRDVFGETSGVLRCVFATLSDKKRPGEWYDRNLLLTGKRFRLENPTIGLDVMDGMRVAITVPARSTIKVVSGPTSESDRLVDVVWGGRTVAMF